MAYRPKKIREKLVPYKGAKPIHTRVLNVKYSSHYATFYDSKGKEVGSIQLRDFDETFKKKGVWKHYGTSSSVYFKRY